MTSDPLAALRALGAGPVVVTAGKMHRPPVGRSRDLDRIRAIPRCAGFSDEERAAIDALLRRPNGTMTLKAAQADALLSASMHGSGLFAPLAVGAGKTLLAALLPTVLECKRPLILTTATLVPQAAAMIRGYREHWKIHQAIEIKSYTALSTPSLWDMLSRLEPDLIIADEAHMLRGRDSARTKRFLWYLKERTGTKLAVLSGTMSKRSIRDCAHLAEHSLGSLSPYPLEYQTLVEWSEALDPDPVREAGALMTLPGEEGDDARARFARRVRETPGVAASQPEELGASLIVRIVPSPTTKAIDLARRALYESWCRPDGEEMITAMEVSEVDRQLRLGGYYAWVTPPDRAWLRARKDYHRAVRTWLATHRRPGVDSPARLWDAIVKDEVDMPEWIEWRKYAHIAEPPRHWVWIDQTIAEWCAEFLRAKVPICAFGEHVEFARRVAELAGVAYFGSGNAAARDILRVDGKKSIVCSRQAHGQGRNLQCFAGAMWFDPPRTGLVFEQTLGRLHRTGQLADAVTYIVPDAFEDEIGLALEDARFLSETSGQVHKLCYASIVRGASRG